MQRTIFTLLVLGLLVVASAAPGATVKLVENSTCLIRLSGSIEAGDAERLLSIWTETTGTSDPRTARPDFLPMLCLDSPGGSLTEAVTIAEDLVARFGIGTMIEENADCLSACALIFMMGRHNHDEWVEVVRRLHYTARLGFHRPGLDVAFPEMVPRAVATSAFEIALDAALDYLRLATEHPFGWNRSFFSDDFVTLVFSTPTDSMLYVDTTGLAGRWGIDVFGYDGPQTIDLLAADDACDALSHWPNQVPVFHNQAETYIDVLRRMAGTADRFFGRIDDGFYRIVGMGEGMDSNSCMIRWQDGTGSYCGNHTGTGFDAYAEWCFGVESTMTDRPREMPPVGSIPFFRHQHLAVFAPNIRLTDLPAASREIERRAAFEALIDLRGGAQLPSCEYVEGPLEITNVASFASLHSAPGFNSPITGRATLGEVVFRSEDRERFVGEVDCPCLRWRRSPGDLDLARRVQQCIASDGLWFQVETASGQVGYISSRFVRAR